MIAEISTHPAGRRAAPGTGGPSILRAPRPDAEVTALLRRLSLYPVRPDESYPLARGRRHWQLAIKAFGSRDRVHSVTERRIPGPSGELRLRIYNPGPRSQNRPVLAWIHGGGFILGGLYTAGGTCRALANRSGAIVAAVEYRLAPEHDLAAGHADCLAALRWLLENAERIGGDPRRLGVGGDSAGGALAAVAAQRCADEGLALAFQVLLYPATDLGGEYPSHRENARGYMLTAENIEWIRRHVRQAADLDDPAFSPLSHNDLSGVAPALIVTAGFDPLRDEGLAYAARLREAGVATRAMHYPGQIHGFMSFDRVLHAAQDALDRVGATVSAVLREGSFDTQSDGVHQLNRGQLPPVLSPSMLAQRWNELRVTQILAADWLQEQARAAVSRTWRVATGRGRSRH